MRLAALGVITAALGIGLDTPGLIGIGIFWVLLGPVMRQHGKRLQEMQAASPDGKPPTDGPTFALGTLLWALLGLPSLLVGVLEIGIDADHENWRWLPFVVGALALGFGGIAALLYLLGGAAKARANQIGVPETPATLWITSVRETGTFVNERPRLEFVFRVEPETSTGMAAYESTKKATVPYTAMAALKVGDGFKALVAGPEHPTSMDVHWDEPVAGAVTAPSAVTERLDALDQLKRDGKVTDAEYQEQRTRILGAL